MEKNTIIKKTENFVKNLLSKEGTGHDWWHIERVRNNAKKQLDFSNCFSLSVLIFFTVSFSRIGLSFIPSYELISIFFTNIIFLYSCLFFKI